MLNPILFDFCSLFLLSSSRVRSPTFLCTQGSPLSPPSFYSSSSDPPLSIAPPTTVSQRRKEEEVKDFFEWWRGEVRIFSSSGFGVGGRGEICSLFQTWLTVVHPIVAKEWREKSSFFSGKSHALSSSNGNRKVRGDYGGFEKSGENFECYFIFPQKYVTLLCSLIK